MWLKYIFSKEYFDIISPLERTIGICTIFVAIPAAAIGIGINLIAEEHKFYFVLGSILSWFIIVLILLLYFSVKNYIVSIKDISKIVTQDKLCKIESNFIGLKRNLLEVDAEIDIKGVLRSKVTSSIFAVHNNISAIEHYKNAPHAPIDGENNIVEEYGIDRSYGTRTYNIDKEEIFTSPNISFWRFRFNPPLRKGNKVKYWYVDRTPSNSFAMNFEEMIKRDLTYEYYSITITYPTEHMIFKISFPKKFDLVNPFYDVWLGKGRVIHIKEYSRIGIEDLFSNTIEKEHNVISLKINNPIHGLVYVLKWIPRMSDGKIPKREELEKIIKAEFP